jgi:uncharacterized protein YciI
MSEWIYFLHPAREDFAATMTDAEREVFGRHFLYLQGLLDQGTLVLAGPTLGSTNTGIAIFRASDELEARAVMEADPVVAEGIVAGELRPFRVSLLTTAPLAEG